MKRIGKITIIGVGLIGGSIGLAVKKAGISRRVAGVFRRPATLRKALKKRAIDEGYMSIREGVSDADIIIIATPVSKIVKKAAEAIKYAKKGAIIIDAGSTKGSIVKAIDAAVAGSGVLFVGSHPMAGSEKTGVEAASSELMRSAPCIVTKTSLTDKRAMNKVIKFWRSLGMKVSVMSPGQHDKSIAMISHLPHIVAFALAGAVSDADIKYGAEGFKDTTRVASSDPDLWADIFFANSKEAVKACRRFENSFRKILHAIAAGNRRSLVPILLAAKNRRDKFKYEKKA